MEPVSLSQQNTGVVSENVRPDAGIGDQARDWKPLYERFGAAEGERTDRMFKEIWDYAKSVADDPNDRDSIMWQISKLQGRIGSPSLGEKPWTKVHAWVSTHNQMRRAEDRMKEMESITN